MKRIISLVLIMALCLLSTAVLFSCQGDDKSEGDAAPATTTVELNENNYWKYINMQLEADNASPGDISSVSCEISGALDFALYEDVVLSFDVIYYTDGQTEEEYQSYTMRIALNAAGDASFETTSLGITNVSVGKWLGADSSLVSLENYNWKIHFKSISGNVIYSL